MVVRGFEDVAGHDVSIFGGLAGDDFTLTGNYVFTNGNESGSGVITVVLDMDKVNVQGFATSGWKPVGTVRTITKSEGNVVYTIDDGPALDMVVRFMGVPKNIDEQKDVLVAIGSEYPIQLQRDDGPPVIRAPLFANKTDHSFVCAGSVPQGAKVRFSMPPDFDIVQAVIDESAELQRTEQPVADALIMFSCMCRHLSLGPLVAEEIQGVKDVWGSPMAGFFSYGEIGRSKRGRHEFHNNTCSLVTLRER